jgi:hypothetical protein
VPHVRTSPARQRRWPNTFCLVWCACAALPVMHRTHTKRNTHTRAGAASANRPQLSTTTTPPSSLPLLPPSVPPSSSYSFLRGSMHSLASAARASPASLRGVVATCLLQQEACISQRKKRQKKTAIHFTGACQRHTTAPPPTPFVAAACTALFGLMYAAQCTCTSTSPTPVKLADPLVHTIVLSLLLSTNSCVVSSFEWWWCGEEREGEGSCALSRCRVVVCLRS